MKKILIYSGSGEWGGAEKYISGIIRGIDNKKYNLALICSNAVLAKDIVGSGKDIKIYSAGPASIFKLLSVLAKEKPDIVYINFHVPYSCLQMVMLSKLCGIKSVLGAVHSVGKPASKIPVAAVLKEISAKIFLPLVGRFIAVSNISKDEFCNNYNISPDKVSVIYNGIEKFEISNDSGEILSMRSSLQIGQNDIVVGTISRIIRDKGIECLIEAVYRVSKEIKNIKCLIVGDGYLLPKIKVKVKLLGIENNIIFTGYRNDILGLLGIMDIFVMPSLHESLPYSLIEAMMAGKGSISTEVGGVEEMIDSGISGKIVKPNDPDELAKAIIILSKNKEYLKIIGEAARQRALKIFSYERMIMETEEFFDRQKTGV